MKILVKFKNGTVDTFNVEKINYFSKNPCKKCRANMSCYDHSCFNSEDWGDFLDLGNNQDIKLQDISHIQIIGL